VNADPFLFDQRKQLIALAAHHAVPPIYAQRQFPMLEGLASWGTDLAAAYRRAGVYVGQFPKGKKSGDLPVHRRSYGLESKPTCVDCCRCSGVKESCKKENTCRENRKVAQANGRRYEKESILSWSFVRFSRIGGNSFCVFDRTAVTTAVAVNNFWGAWVPITWGLSPIIDVTAARKHSAPRLPWMLLLCSLDCRPAL
jgi:hypothetical protein